MNDVELKALELKRKAWEVLDAKLDADALFQELYRLERQMPDFFELVAKQLEADNGRWSPSSALPNVEVKRDETSRIEEISFHAIGANISTAAEPGGKSEFQHVAIPKSASDELNRAAAEEPGQMAVVVWRSDYGDRMWIEDFAKDYMNGDGRKD